MVRGRARGGKGSLCPPSTPPPPPRIAPLGPSPQPTLPETPPQPLLDPPPIRPSQNPPLQCPPPPPPPPPPQGASGQQLVGGVVGVQNGGVAMPATCHLVALTPNQAFLCQGPCLWLRTVTSAGRLHHAQYEGGLGQRLWMLLLTWQLAYWPLTIHKDPTSRCWPTASVSPWWRVMEPWWQVMEPSWRVMEPWRRVMEPWWRVMEPWWRDMEPWWGDMKRP